MEKNVRFENKGYDDLDIDEVAARQGEDEAGSSSTLSNDQLNHDLEAAGKWRNVAKQIRNAVIVKNAVKPSRSRRRSTVKSAVTVDPFLQKFSTRENRKITPPNRKRSKGTSKSLSRDSMLAKVGDTLSPPCTEIERELDSELTSGSIYDYDQSVRWRDRKPVFDPDGMFVYVWFYFLAFAIRYNLWALILRVAFPEAQTGYLKVAWFSFDYFCDAVYGLDIVISARTGFLEEGILVTDTKRVARRYIRSAEFIADVVSLIPTDILYAVFGPLPVIRINRIIKGYKSFSINAVMESQASYPTFLRVFFLMHLMFLLIHWNAGFYYMISRAEGFGTNDWVYQGNGSLYQQYLQSFYWSTLTLTAIGDLPQPTTNIEFVYTIACYLAGVFMFATIVGNAGSIIVNRNAVRLDFEKQRENTKQYMKKHNVPRDLQRRVVMWYDYSWSRGRMSTGGGDLNSLTLLPNKLKTEIALHVNLETLRKVTFLQKCQPEFLHDLVLKMKLRIFTPGDLVCKKSEVAREMYVIINGKIEVIGDQGQVLKTLSGGDFFGEIGILSLSEGQNRRTADVRTVGYLECFVLSKEDVLSAIRDYPEAQAVLAEYGKKRLQRQNSSQDPRLVDMEDSTSGDKLDNNTDTNANVKELPSQGTENHQGMDVILESESSSNVSLESSQTNCSSNRTSNFGHLSLRIPQAPARGILEPISPRRSSKQMFFGDTVLQSPALDYDSKNTSETTVTKDQGRSGTTNDGSVASIFNDSCMEAFNLLRKTLEDKMAKEVKQIKSTLKDVQESSKQKDEKIVFLKSRLQAQAEFTNKSPTRYAMSITVRYADLSGNRSPCPKEQELDALKSRVMELELENFAKEQTIQQLREQEEHGIEQPRRSRTMSTTVSVSSLTDREADTHC